MPGDVLPPRRCHHRARPLWRRRRHREACTAQDRAVRLYTRSGSGGPELAAILSARADYASALAEHAVAAPLYREAVRHVVDVPEARVTVLIKWGTCERLRGRNAEALEHLASAQELAARLDPALRAAAANGLGVLAKDAGHYDRAACGDTFLAAGVARHVVDAAPDPFTALTARERQLLSLLAEGVPTTAMARRLGVAPKTVSNTLSAVYAKLGVTNRTEAALRARDAGMGG
jgi:DNA-binding NarL/FixJ family response regulator